MNIVKFDDAVKVEIAMYYDNYEDDVEINEGYEEYDLEFVEWYAHGVDIKTGNIFVTGWLAEAEENIASVFVKPADVIWGASDQDVVDDIDDEYEEPSYIINKDSVTLTYQDKVLSTNDSNKEFKTIVAHIINGNYEDAARLFSPSTVIKHWVDGLLEVKDDRVYYNGFELKGKFVEKILKYAQEGRDVNPFLKFLKLSMEQENREVLQRLLDFAADDTIEFSSEGYVIAFKNVQNDYYDKHSRTFRNMVGDKPSVPRSSVDADHNTTCSHGLHVCSFKYLMDCWGTDGKNMLVYVHPRDFVAVPYDYKDSKARVCQYEVADELTQDKLDHLIAQHNM